MANDDARNLMQELGQRVGCFIYPIVIAGLVGAGLLPIRCAQHMPFGVGQKYQDHCAECDGDGKQSRPCRSCLGRGYYGGARCQACGGGASVEQTCVFCAGSGRKPTE